MTLIALPLISLAVEAVGDWLKGLWRASSVATGVSVAEPVTGSVTDATG